MHHTLINYNSVSAFDKDILLANDRLWVEEILWKRRRVKDLLLEGTGDKEWHAVRMRWVIESEWMVCREEGNSKEPDPVVNMTVSW